MLFDEEKWNKNVSLYDLVGEDGKVVEQKYLLHEDAGLLNRVYLKEERGVEWREVNWKKKTNKKKKKK